MTDTKYPNFMMWLILRKDTKPAGPSEKTW